MAKLVIDVSMYMQQMTLTDNISRCILFPAGEGLKCQSLLQQTTKFDILFLIFEVGGILLTLKGPITTVADDTFNNIFLGFRCK